jgi:hypothetical protein
MMTRFNKSTGQVLQEFPFGNTIELVDVYDQYTFPGGITLNNVAHFRVHVHGTGPAEEMMFSGGNLVYWKEITNNPERQVKSGQYAGQRWESWVSAILPENYTINPIYPAWFQPHLTPVPQPPSITALLSNTPIPDPEPEEPEVPTPRRRRNRVGSFLYQNTRLTGAPRWEEMILGRNIAHPVGWDVYMEEFWSENPPPFVYNQNPGWQFKFEWISGYAGLINRDRKVLQPGLYAAVCEVNPTINSHPTHVKWNFRFNLGGNLIVDHRHAPLNAVEHAGVCELPIRVTEPVEIHSFASQGRQCRWYGSQWC